MDDSEYLCPAEAEAYSRFSRNSGTYYVDGRRKCNWKRYLCILFLLPLLLLVCAAAIYGYILYANEPVKDDKVENQPVRDELENCNISNANIAAFTDFFNKYGRNQSSRTCEKLACFTANTASLPHYQGIELVGDYLGNTDFSDMCIDDRRKYLLGSLPAVETDVNFNEHAFPESYNCTGEVPQIVYNDTLGLANNIIAGLLQWTYHGNETLSNSTSLAEYIEISKHNQDPLYRLNLVSELIENNQTRQAYLAINGPFATGGSINDGFFFIREHTFPDAICLKADVEQTDVVVIVVGYEDVDGSKSWYVQPVGEKWHNHAKNDTKTGDVVKISDDCFKKVFKFVIGFNNVEGRPSALTFF